MNEVYSYLVRYFSSDDWTQEPSNLDKLFNALSVAKLWNYDHYGLLEDVVKKLFYLMILLCRNSYLSIKVNSQVSTLLQKSQISSSFLSLRTLNKTLSNHCLYTTSLRKIITS